MKISAINTINKQLTFKAGKSILYSDFDGTLLPQPLHDVYNGTQYAKNYSVKGFNRYFKDFQDYINETNEKFSIVINTGRRLIGDNKEGFEPTYLKMKQEGINLPKIISIITSEGGDIYDFNPDGTISHIPNKEKALAVKNACGWDNEEIKSAMDEVSKELKTEYKFVNNRGSYKLSAALQDKDKTEVFTSRLQEILGPKMGIKISTDMVKDNGVHIKGFKLHPIINGHKIHKDFDIKIALDKAIKENDFLIVAGDAENDKEALNIFRYLKNPPQSKIPKDVGEITQEYVSQVKDEVDNLPIKILFIKPDEAKANIKTLKLYDYMEKLQKLFPKKVEIVKETKLYQENNFLNAIKNATEEYSKENYIFKTARNTLEKYSSTSCSKQIFKNIPIIGACCLLGLAIFALFKQEKDIKTQKQLNNQPKENIINT